MNSGKPPLWRVMFLIATYGRMTLTLQEVADQIGIAPGTIKNRRSRGEFAWLRSDGRQLSADVEDVAQYLHRLRHDATGEARGPDKAARKPYTRPAGRRGPVR